jgi:hypothetical protein
LVVCSCLTEDACAGVETKRFTLVKAKIAANYGKCVKNINTLRWQNGKILIVTVDFKDTALEADVL